MKEACPVLKSITQEDQCLENFAGLGSTLYVFDVDKIDKAALVATKNVYAWAEGVFKTGGCFYTIPLKTQSNSISSESQGMRKGYKLSGNFVLEVNNEATGELARALNNMNCGYVIPDGEGYQILYSPYEKVSFDSGGVKAETGAAGTDDRTTTLTPTLANQKYANYYVTFPEGKSPEDYLTPVAGS